MLLLDSKRRLWRQPGGSRGAASRALAALACGSWPAEGRQNCLEDAMKRFSKS